MSYSVKRFKSRLNKLFLNKVPKRNRILVACFPKSGSTFLSKALSSVLDYKKITVYGDSRGNEQYLDETQIYSYKKVDFVSQIHCPATIPNIEKIKKWNLKTIVLTRNIFDTLLSVHEFVLYKEWKRVEFTAAFVDIYVNLRLKEQKEFLINLVAPWYIKFYVSWYKNIHLVNGQWVTYEQLVNNKDELIGSILDFLGKPELKNKVLNSITTLESSNGVRKNVGIVGRGLNFFSEQHKNKIYQLLGFYKDVDFTNLGINKQI